MMERSHPINPPGPSLTKDRSSKHNYTPKAHVGEGTGEESATAPKKPKICNKKLRKLLHINGPTVKDIPREKPTDSTFFFAHQHLPEDQELRSPPNLHIPRIPRRGEVLMTRTCVEVSTKLPEGDHKSGKTVVKAHYDVTSHPSRKYDIETWIEDVARAKPSSPDQNVLPNWSDGLLPKSSEDERSVDEKKLKLELQTYKSGSVEVLFERGEVDNKNNEKIMPYELQTPPNTLSTHPRDTPESVDDEPDNGDPLKPERYEEPQSPIKPLNESSNARPQESAWFPMRFIDHGPSHESDKNDNQLPSSQDAFKTPETPDTPSGAETLNEFIAETLPQKSPEKEVVSLVEPLPVPYDKAEQHILEKETHGENPIQKTKQIEAQEKYEIPIEGKRPHGKHRHIHRPKTSTKTTTSEETNKPRNAPEKIVQQEVQPVQQLSEHMLESPITESQGEIVKAEVLKDQLPVKTLHKIETDEDVVPTHTQRKVSAKESPTKPNKFDGPTFSDARKRRTLAQPRTSELDDNKQLVTHRTMKVFDPDDDSLLHSTAHSESKSGGNATILPVVLRHPLARKDTDEKTGSMLIFTNPSIGGVGEASLKMEDSEQSSGVVPANYDDLATIVKIMKPIGTEAFILARKRQCAILLMLLPLIILSIILLCLISPLNLLAILFIAYQPAENCTNVREAPQLPICNTVRCGVSGSTLFYSINFKSDPCKSITTHVCSNWIKRPSSEYERLALGADVEFTNRIFRDLKDRFEKTGKHKTGSDAMKKAMRIYQSCISVNRRNYDGIRDLKEIMRTYGLATWPMPSKSDLTVVNLIKSLAMFIRDTGSGTIFQIKLTPSTTDQKYLPIVDCGTFDIPIETLVEFKDAQAGVITKYTEMIKAIATEYGKPSDIKSESFINNIVTFETNLANRRFQQCQSQKLEKYKVSEMPTIGFDWKLFFEIVFEDVFNAYPTNLYIYARSKAYMSEVTQLFTGNGTALRVYHYIGWRVLNHYHKYTTLAQSQISSNFYNVEFGHDTPALWKQCLLEVNKVMPLAVGRFFADYELCRSSNLDVHIVTAKLMKTLERLLWQVKTLDGESADRAHGSLAASSMLIGYPSWIQDNKVLDREYANVLTNGSFLGQYISASRVNTQLYFSNLKLNTVGSRPISNFILPSSPNSWATFSHEGTFYNGLDRLFVIPSGILQPPYYTYDSVMSLNFGGLGLLLSRDLVSQILFKAFGNQEDTYNLASECLANELAFQGTPTPEEMSLLMTDIFGVKLAYEAYHDYMDQKPEATLPNMINFTPDQLFFIASVRNICSQLRDMYSVKMVMLKKDVPHLAYIDRSFRSMSEFSDAFRCHRNQKLQVAPSKLSKCLFSWQGESTMSQGKSLEIDKADLDEPTEDDDQIKAEGTSLSSTFIPSTSTITTGVQPQKSSDGTISLVETTLNDNKKAVKKYLNESRKLKHDLKSISRFTHRSTAKHHFRHHDFTQTRIDISRKVAHTVSEKPRMLRFPKPHHRYRPRTHPTTTANPFRVQHETLKRFWEMDNVHRSSRLTIKPRHFWQHGRIDPLLKPTEPKATNRRLYKYFLKDPPRVIRNDKEMYIRFTTPGRSRNSDDRTNRHDQIDFEEPATHNNDELFF